MTLLSTAGGAGMLAHTVHYAVVGAGLLGLTLMLTPSLLQRLAPAAASPRDEHEVRVLALRAELAAGTLTRPGTPLLATPPRAVSAPVALSASLAFPVALVSSTAAAGVHAAVGPAHLGATPILGAFFLLTALVQVGWTIAAATRPSRLLVELAVVGNTALLGLWLVTRTWGLPGGLLPGPEPFGPWDLACAGWEITLLLACAALLRRREVGETAGWLDWHPLARGWFAASVLVLGLLSVSGAGS